MTISVIIPTYNEGAAISSTIKNIKFSSRRTINEIIVADGGSTDNTVKAAEAAGALVYPCPKKGRAAQMNYGAKQAQGEVLYFLHADTHPPKKFDDSIHQVIAKGHGAGCFRLSFDERHWLLGLYAWFTRFNSVYFRFGDQSLFMSRSLFHKLQGFREDHIVMEDQEIVRRVKRMASFKVMDDEVQTSARKYRKHGVVVLQVVFIMIFCLYYAGIGQETLANIYKRLIS